jgi:6-phosphogluconolactonase
MTRPANVQVIVCPDADALAERAAERIIDAAGRAVATAGRFTLALAGGSTPEKAYALLTRPPRVQRLPWDKTYLFFGDDRFVPHDDPRSNYAMAHRSLLAQAPIPAGQVFAIPMDRPTPAESAVEYGRTLASFFSVTPGAGVPCFDLILLGMGDDGHTASLFPGKPALHEASAWVTSSPPGVLPPPVDRVTFTFPVLNAAREVLFLVAGEKKAEPLRQVLEEPADVERFPSSGVQPSNGALVWLIDEAATRLLKR